MYGMMLAQLVVRDSRYHSRGTYQVLCAHGRTVYSVVIVATANERERKERGGRMRPSSYPRYTQGIVSSSTTLPGYTLVLPLERFRSDLTRLSSIPYIIDVNAAEISNMDIIRTGTS